MEEREFLQHQWLEETRQQRLVDDARVVWSRWQEKNRRDVEERAEQLKGLSTLAALIAGFALTAFLQFQFDPSQSTSGVQLAFGLTIAICVALEANSMVLCSLINASILKTARNYVSVQEEADFMARARTFALNYRPGDRPPAPRRSFQRYWARHCEGQWRLAFWMFSAGVPVFFVNMTLAAWIKFDYEPKTAIWMTVVMGLAFLFFLWQQNHWSWHLLGGSASPLEDALPQAQATGTLHWDWHAPPAGLQRLPSHGMQKAHSSLAEVAAEDNSSIAENGLR